MTAEKYVAYYRVSTQRQGRSGLGLEAQQEAVRALVDRNGGSCWRRSLKSKVASAVIVRSFAERSVVPK
jgi:DNA invertase Pin-like site-specific DNA recombinase